MEKSKVNRLSITVFFFLSFMLQLNAQDITYDSLMFNKYDKPTPIAKNFYEVIHWDDCLDNFWDLEIKNSDIFITLVTECINFGNFNIYHLYIFKKVREHWECLLYSNPTNSMNIGVQINIKVDSEQEKIHFVAGYLETSQIIGELSFKSLGIPDSTNTE